MRKGILFTFLAATALFSTGAMAQRYNTDINLEPTCRTPGSGMDPRCIGDTTPGTDRALRRTRSGGQRYDSRVKTYHRAATRPHINCAARANRRNRRCMR